MPKQSNQLWSVTINLPELHTKNVKIESITLNLTASETSILQMLFAYYNQMIKPAIKEMLAGDVNLVGPLAQTGTAKALAIEIFAVIDMLVYRRLEAHNGHYIRIGKG